jgi:predicted DNA-binding protein (UPF0251 family)
MMTHYPQNACHDQLRMNGLNVPPVDGRRVGRLYGDTSSNSNNNSMFFPSGMNGMGMAGVDMQMMQTIMNARRLRAAQQINQLRMLQASTNTSIATKSNSLPPTLKGLNLLGSVSTSLTSRSQSSKVSSQPTSSHLIPVSPPVSLNRATVKLSIHEVEQCASKIESVEQSLSVDESPIMFIDTIQEWDVLCGRGGRSNHHPGNKRYRHVVSEMKMMYRRSEAKAIKTDLSRAIVEHCCNYGGRFIKNDSKSGRYYVLTKAEARKKTSQALRETKALKWTY